MSKHDDNPYAHHKLNYPAVRLRIPLAQEVLRHNRFPNLSTRYLRQLNRANVQLFCLEILYFLAGVLSLFYLPIGVLLIIFGFVMRKMEILQFKNLVSIFVLVMLVISLFSMCVHGRRSFSLWRISE